MPLRCIITFINLRPGVTAVKVSVSTADRVFYCRNHYGLGGNSKRNFITQIIEVSLLRRNYPRVIRADRALMGDSQPGKATCSLSAWETEDPHTHPHTPVSCIRDVSLASDITRWTLGHAAEEAGDAKPERAWASLATYLGIFGR